jgi:HD-like signal output (HDOD) protein
MKRILFVDDEAAILAGIRTMLHKRRNEWQMDFVESGADAIAAMEKQAYDLICSDMRMPQMDGAQLLTIVSERWPQTVRIVLSGYSQMEQTMRLVPIAHQYLSKPCATEQFGNVVERCLHVQEMLSRPSLRAVVGRVKKLPSVPKTYEKLRAALAQPNVSVADIAKIVSADVAISAKVLQVVNSAFFRLAKRMAKIDQAVGYLGFSTIRNLVLSVEVFSQWNKAGAAKCGFDADQMQSQALLTAAVARGLATGTSLADDALVAGLLCDIGYLILVAECPDDVRKARKLAADKGIPLYQAERETIGASHAEVGAYLLALWGFPYSLIEAVAHHHAPEVVAHSEFDLLSLLSIATALTSQDGEVAKIDDATSEQYLQTVHAPFTWAKAQECMQAIKSAGEPAGV